MIPSVLVDVDTGPLCKKAAEKEFAPLLSTLPGGPVTARPEVVLRP